ncbi:MAG: glycosyltransferase family 39 protein [Candidatus Bathyarchaeota archaeon]|nr:glycosyltransferase family 39 protein [Candidatus Bathyarchaeota archaeon]
MTINQPSIKQRLPHLWLVLNRWRLLLFGFLLVYLIILLSDLAYPPMQWDEVIHLNAGSFLSWGNYDKFVVNAFYPPLYDVITFAFFEVFGVSLFVARLVPVMFSLLSLWAVFELAYHLYSGRVALLSAVFLGVMPGFFWLSTLSMLETALVFFTTASLLFFYKWLTTRQDRLLVFSGLALGLGLLTKYQMIVAAIVILLSILFLARNQLKFALKKLTITFVTAALVVAPWVIIAFRVYADQILRQWLYALQVGNPERSLYSERFPMPIFYLIEMVWPYDTLHPISLFIYIAGIAGLGFFAWRRRREDKFMLIWFLGIYVFFTLIANKEWRYVLPLFPVIAISASAAFFTFYGRLEGAWKTQSSISKKRLFKAASVLLVALMVCSVAVSVYDTYDYVSKYQVNIDIKGATDYAYNNIGFNKSIMVLCPFNFFSREMVRFYLWADGDNKIPVFQYPRKPVDTYTPNFNITELIHLCKILQVQYVFTYEYGGTVPYYNTTLNLQQVYQQLYASGNFTHITENATFGENPRRIFILEYTG